MEGNRHISVTTEERGLRAVVVPFQRPYFLRRKLHFYLLAAVIATTLLSWFNINSWLIILLTACRLFDGRPADAIRTAFSNRWFLAWVSLFVLEAAGLFHTHDLFACWKHVESKATLVAIPFILCAGPFADRGGYRRLCQAYCLILAGLSLFCLISALSTYYLTGVRSVFFYHRLTAVFDSNAIFFSWYVLMALLFLLADPTLFRGVRTWLILFFTGVMVLLASKLLLALLAIFFILYLNRRYRVRVKRWQFAALTSLVVLGIVALAFTRNPVGRRYAAIMHNDRNGVSLRLFIWRSAGEILQEKHAWLFGVTAGDSRDLLNEKYLAAGLSRGYIGYNCHNQFVEVLLRSGLVGLIVLSAAVASLIGLARQKGTMECWLAVVSFILLSMTQSTLEMQQPAFLSCFFPLLLWWAPGKKFIPLD